MIKINCQRFDVGVERLPSILHTKTPEDALSFLFKVDLRWNCRFEKVTETELITSTGICGLNDITTYSGSKEDMGMLVKAVNTFISVKRAKTDDSPHQMQSIKNLVGHISFGKDTAVFVDQTKNLFVGTGAARITCLVLISIAEAFAHGVSFEWVSDDELISMMQLVLFHKATVKDLV